MAVKSMSITSPVLPPGYCAAPAFERPMNEGLHDNSRPLDPKERKRIQNRLAQRTYSKIDFSHYIHLINRGRLPGRNQKLRMWALEEAVEKRYDGTVTPVVTEIHNTIPYNSQQQVSDNRTAISHNAQPQVNGVAISTLPDSPTNGAENEFIVPHDTQPEDSMWMSDPDLNELSLPKVQIESGRPALHRAAWNGNESMTELLLDRGADITIQDSVGQTALHVAVENKCEGVLRVFVEKKVDLNVKDSQGRTALFAAVRGGNLGVVKYLLESSVDVNSKDIMGNAALHLAVEQGSEPLTHLLLAHGADINA
jgi:ankyrin repeat protein